MELVVCIVKPPKNPFFYRMKLKRMRLRRWIISKIRRDRRYAQLTLNEPLNPQYERTDYEQDFNKELEPS